MMHTPVSAVAGLDGPVDGRGAAPARQQRRVDIEATQSGSGTVALLHGIEHPLRQDQSVGRDDHRVGLRRQDGLARGRGIVRKTSVQAQAARLAHGDGLLAGQTP